MGNRRMWTPLNGAFSLIFFSLSLLAGGLILPAETSFAQPDGAEALAPLNPNFLQYLNDQKTGVLAQPEIRGAESLGLIPSPVDLTHLRGKKVVLDYRLQAFAPYYDLRQEEKVTPVRHQGTCGSCWAFASYGSLESNLLPSESLDLSENHLKDTHGFDWGYCDGGNASISTAYLTRWSGPVYESDDPYNQYSNTSPPGLDSRKHIQNVLIIPDRADALDNDGIKQAIIDHGALYSTMYYSGTYYNDTYDAYYFNGTSYSNHAIAIVGWDDNFDKNKFSYPAPANGAFIIRNSWGTSWGENGYFYISYYDSNIGTENFVFVEAQETTNYSQIYQYDPLGWVSSFGYGTPTAWLANIFTATSWEQLSAVSFYAASLDSSYEIYIYTNVTSGSPRSGVLAASQSGTLNYPGYYTLPLSTPVNLTQGQRFSVVLRLTTPDYNYPVALENPYANYSSQAAANLGESYVSSSGTSWLDLASQFADTNVCLKAFTLPGTNEILSAPSSLLGPLGGAVGTPYVYVAGGSSSSLGDEVQYFLEWGDGTNSDWLPAETTSASKSWDTVGTYAVRAKARCVTHPDIESDWSESLSVWISDTAYIAVTVLTPNGGEPVPSGSVYTIQWGAPPEAVKFTVRTSVDNGVTWNTIAKNVTANSYNWNVPRPVRNKKKCRVKVIGYDETGTIRLSDDVSDSPFTIEVIRLDSPNGGEMLISGDPAEVGWITHQTRRPVAKVRLYYTKNNGTSWILIRTIKGSPTGALWTVPTVLDIKPNCKLKVVLLDSNGYSVGSDVSDGPFNIDP